MLHFSLVDLNSVLTINIVFILIMTKHQLIDIAFLQNYFYQTVYTPLTCLFFVGINCIFIVSFYHASVIKIEHTSPVSKPLCLMITFFFDRINTRYTNIFVRLWFCSFDTVSLIAPSMSSFLYLACCLVHTSSY